MIVSKEQRDFINDKGEKQTELIVSYVSKDHKISFLRYPIPKDQMFIWKYSNRQNADPIWKSYDNKWVRKFPTDRLNELRVNELLCSFGERIDPIFEMNVPETWFSDIEVDVTDTGFPKAEDADNPINTIAITKFPKTIVFGRKHLTEDEIDYIKKKLKTYSSITKDYEFEYREFTNETDMLRAYIDFIVPIPALTGWNFIPYDWQYIFNRAGNIGLSLDRVSPTGKFENFRLSNKAGIKLNARVPLHKIIYDYLAVYRNWDQSVAVKENNTLDFVAEQVLGIKKVVHNMGFREFYDNYYKDYVFYNCVDSILVEQIDKKIKTSNVWFSLASELKTDLNMAFSTIKPTEVVMTDFLYKDFKVIPSKKFEDTGKADYEGAFVWPTRPGIYKNIGSLDFSSLYPHIMMQWQISPESFIKKDIHYVPKENEIKTSSGAVFRKDPKAIIPRILKVYFGKRKEAKAMKKEANKEYEELKHILDKRKVEAMKKVDDK